MVQFKAIIKWWWRLEVRDAATYRRRHRFLLDQFLCLKHFSLLSSSSYNCCTPRHPQVHTALSKSTQTHTHTVLTQLKDIEVNVCVLWYSSWYSRLLQSLDMVFEFDQFLPLQVVEMYRNAFQTDQFLCGNDSVLWHSAKSPAWIWNRPVIILMYIESLSSWQVDSVFWIAKAGLEIKRRAGEMKVLNHWIRYFQTTHPHDFCFAVRAMAEGDLWVAVFVGKASSKQLGPK